MRKYSLFTVIVILLLALAACSSGDETAVPAGEAEAIATSSSTTPEANLAPLPSLAGASGLATGMGGGGGDGDGSEQPAGETSMRAWNPLAEATLNLAVDLPAEPQSAPVYEQPGSGLYTVDDVAGLAAAFGLNSPIYLERYPEQVEPAEWVPPTVYMLFDGRRQLAVADSYFYYLDENAMPGVEIIEPYSRAQQAAESYLQERGLLDFPYQVQSNTSYDFEFRRLIDGRPVLYPEFMVSVNGDGEIWSVSHNPLSQLSSLGEYPLRPAAEAWQAVQDNGFDYQTTFFTMLPGSDYVQPEMEPFDFEKYRYWERAYAEGETMSIYPYPLVYAPISEGDAPRIQVDRYLLIAPAEELTALAEYAGKPIHLTGNFRTVDGRQAVELVSWEPLEADNQWIWGEGTVRSEGDLTLVDTSEGETLAIPARPENMIDGDRIYFNGWEKVAGDGPYPSLNWQSMGILIDEPQVEQPVIEPEVIDPNIVKEVTIDGVNLAYAFVPLYDEQGQALRYVIQPVWQFSGTADNGMLINIYAQAAAGEYVSPGPAG